MSMLPTHQLKTASAGPFRVAVTGHCDLGDETVISFVAQTFSALLGQFKRVHPAGVVALSGLAPGADTIFAEVALGLAIPLEVCIAASAVVEKYALGPERDQHFRLRALSRPVTKLPFTKRSAEAYLALGGWLVNSCDLLIAAWNGWPPSKPGGTGDVVAIAQQCGRPVIHIHTLRRTTALLVSGSIDAPVE
jgi:hypothetical protein